MLLKERGSGRRGFPVQRWSYREREARQRASQNTKCLNLNTLENSRAPKNRRASPFSNCSCTGKTAYQRGRVKSGLHYSQKVGHNMEDSAQA